MELEDHSIGTSPAASSPAVGLPASMLVHPEPGPQPL